MPLSRLFFSQEVLDDWLTSDRVTIDQDAFTIVGIAATFELKTALHFVNEVAGGGDEAKLVGKVKDLEQLAALDGEHCADSVILGDNAYEVTEGFVAEYVEGDPEATDASLFQAPAGTDDLLAVLAKRLLEG